ncbi:RNA polymerase sigma factor [Sphingomonas sp. VDB2]|uniref:RNA polymerase sigma factor n=1 Tax=Sphingomonas sp. VDB2 TaxID=3228751 RepID=UPI003A811D61
MFHSSVQELLQAARDFIADIPPLALLNAPRRRGRKLVIDIDQVLAAAPWKAAPVDLLEDARKHWQGRAIQIDDDAVMRADAAGLWVGAWVLAAPPITTISTIGFRTALDALPIMEREVYVLHRVEGRPFSYLAERLGITIGQAETLLLNALHQLHVAIYGH